MATICRTRATSGGTKGENYIYKKQIPVPSMFFLEYTINTLVIGYVVALRVHQVPRNAPKITCLLSASTAKQQNPQDSNETAFQLVLQCTYKQTTESSEVSLCIAIQDAHVFKWQVPHSHISLGRWPHKWQQTPSSFSSSSMVAPPLLTQTQAHEAKRLRADTEFAREYETE